MTSKTWRRRPTTTSLWLWGGLFAGALTAAPLAAQACGCFAPPDPSVPIVQAGERILFVQDSGVVTAHIQIQYSGKPAEFGWLLPLPAVPKDRAGKDGIDLGVDEVFTQLIATTQPKYHLSRIYEPCGGRSSGGFGGVNAPSAAEDAGSNGGGGSSPLVTQASVGPYDYAILKADSKDAMFKWLTDNRYFIPTGTESAVGPYIHPGAYFLALRLRAGQSAGDLQPVVLRYQSDKPMIPLVLTSVAANPNMGIQVWMLGAARAIPSNYYHTVINDAQIDWLSAGSNYNDVIIKAVGEAVGKHSFVTEYAGSSKIMDKVLDADGRFDVLKTLATVSSPVSYVQQVVQSGLTTRINSSGGGIPGPFLPSLSAQLSSLLAQYVPLPSALAQKGVTLAQYYQQIDFYLNQDRAANPSRYADIEAALAAFDPGKLTAEIQTRIVTPTLDAGKLFTNFSYLTRLYSTLSPEDMNKDPVFSYNPSLPTYSNVHEATLTYHCGGFQYTSATLDTASGWRIEYSIDDANAGRFQTLPLPYSQRIETLGEIGAPKVVVDNATVIDQLVGPKASGCAATGSSAGSASGMVGAVVALLALLARRRSRAW